MGKAELHNAEGELLLELNKDAFQSLIRYSDPGTLILQAPEVLKMAPVNLGTNQNIRVGDMLVVAHQSPGDPNKIALLSVKVEAIGTYQSKTVLYYSNNDRMALIVPGDSGGGVWLDGQYVGNNWGMYLSQAGPFWNRQTVQTTIAAQLPAGFLQTSQASHAPGETLSSGEPLNRWDLTEANK